MKLKTAIELSKEKVFIIGLKIINDIRRSLKKNNLDKFICWISNGYGNNIILKPSDFYTDRNVTSKEFYKQLKIDIDIIGKSKFDDVLKLKEKYDRVLEKRLKLKVKIDDEYEKIFPNYKCVHCGGKVTKEQKFCHQCGGDTMKSSTEWIYTKYKEPKTTIEEKLKYDYDFTSSEYLKEILKCGNHRAVKFLQQKYKSASEICGFCSLRGVKGGCNDKPPCKHIFCGDGFKRFYPNEKFYELLYGDE